MMKNGGGQSGWKGGVKERVEKEQWQEGGERRERKQ